MQDCNRSCSLQAPDAYQLITAADGKQCVAGITRNVSDLCRMTSHCTQQSASLSTPHFHQLIIGALTAQILHSLQIPLKKVKECIAVSGIPSHSYGTSLAIWDHTVLPATRHK